MESCKSLVALFTLFLVSISALARTSDRLVEGTIAFASVGRAHYAFDIFLVDLPELLSGQSRNLESRVTDGISVNYNGHLVEGSEQNALLKALNSTFTPNAAQRMLAYVSERDGSVQIRFNLFFEQDKFLQQTVSATGHSVESIVDLGKLSFSSNSGMDSFAMHDKPSLSNGRIIFMSTRERRKESRQSWVAVYSTDISTKRTVRLTPEGVTDYSPAVSPSGKLVAVASNQGRGWGGEVEELDTDLYVFDAADGSNRRLVAEHGGWPSWADEHTLFFHRRAPDGWWSIYKVTLSSSKSGPERVTPSGVHCFTPAASRTGKFIAIATRRPGSRFRHIEFFDLQSKKFSSVTELINPEAHHLNPFLSADSSKIGYHRCRGRDTGSLIPRLEHIVSPVPKIALVRVDGNFPVFSADGQYIAFLANLDDGGIYVTHLDGSGMTKVFSEHAFGLSWDKRRKGVLYTSYGTGFQPPNATVHIVSVLNADKLISGETESIEWRVLTKEGTLNNAFPSVSPDGKWVVFRSGRSGYKNLYIMDAVHGEEGGLRRLTEGNWTDTMASWSHDGEWIAFSSDRHNPGGGSFALYFVHPDGTGLHLVLNSSIGGRVNHPYFSPDSKSLVVTTDYSGISAEPVSVPNQFQPYGEIFIMRVDGTELVRLTHNAYEDGTPSWGPVFLNASALSNEGQKTDCRFDDQRWLVPPKKL